MVNGNSYASSTEEEEKMRSGSNRVSLVDCTIMFIVCRKSLLNVSAFVTERSSYMNILDV